MRNLALFCVIGCSLMGCSGDGAGSGSGPFEALGDVFGGRPEPIGFEGGYTDYGPAPTFGAPAAGPQSPYGEPATALQIQGHLEGQLRDIPLSGDTTDNYGELLAGPNSGGYLSANVALGTPRGAGMMILSVNGGLQHPVFSEGRWSNARELAVQSQASYTGEQAVYVGSCAGPAIGDYPYEQQAVDYDMTVETDPLDPDTVVVVVAASFYVNEQSSQTSELSGTLRFVRPE